MRYGKYPYALLAGVLALTGAAPAVAAPILGVCAQPASADTAPTAVVRYDTPGKHPPTSRLWLPVIAYNQDPGVDPHTAPDPDRFAAYAASVALEARGRVVAYEIWNEPNMPRFWRNPDPHAYAQVYLKARAAIRKVDPHTPVLIGGIADITGWRDYARTVIRLTRPDGLALHPYVQPVRSTRHALRLGVPVWVTEVGAGRDNMTDTDRGAYLLRTVRRLRRLPIRALFLYSWEDPAWSVNDGAALAGVLRGMVS